MRSIGWGLLLILLSLHGTLASEPTKRILLIGQSPDSHKPATHEYMPAAALMYSMLSRVDGVQPIVVKADGPWQGGPDLIDSSDGVFLFASEGAKWISGDAQRLAAFQRLAKRGGGLTCWHWGMGTKEAPPIEAFVDLFGGSHGGPDRKHHVMQVDVTVATPKHPVVQNVKPFHIKEEFYYALKFGKNPKRITPLLTIKQDGGTHPVGWAWDRSDGGRSFGFSGGHYHDHWRNDTYRRLAVQGVLWTVKVPFDDKLDVSANEQLIKLRPRRKAQQ